MLIILLFISFHVGLVRNSIGSVLSRKTFLANIHDPDDPDTSLERINTDLSTQTITRLLLFLYIGENSCHFDDTIGTMDVFGGPNSDYFYIGQMFNDERTEAYGVATNDPIDTTLTTKGYLSDGCSHPITINGGELLLCRTGTPDPLSAFVFMSS